MHIIINILWLLIMYISTNTPENVYQRPYITAINSGILIKEKLEPRWSNLHQQQSRPRLPAWTFSHFY